jgi:hypothetical protein
VDGGQCLHRRLPHARGNEQYLCIMMIQMKN